MTQRQEDREKWIINALVMCRGDAVTASEVLEMTARRTGYPTLATTKKDLLRLVDRGTVERFIGTGPRNVDCFRLHKDAEL